MGSDIVMTLVAPSGRVIDRDTVAGDVEHLFGDTFESYTITDPEAGEWTVELFGADVPEEGEDVSLAVEMMQSDSDDDGIIDQEDNCVDIANPGQEDSDNDGRGNACDGCGSDPGKTEPGICGCGVQDVDSDDDGYCLCQGDCDDNDPDISPGAEEICDGLDNDCDREIDEGFDQDGDGIPDCSDNCAVYNPDQADTNNDGQGDACDPVVTSVTGPADPVAIDGAPVVVVGAFTDADDNGNHTAQWDWGDTTSTAGSVDQSANSVSGSHIYAAAGVYAVKLTVYDGYPASGEAVFEFVVVYDPEGGFVTGGGWINSPGGAYYPDPTLTGKAKFGFVSKYKKGATIPTGETEFNFTVADLNFHSTSYDWLVIAGAKAKYKGIGTINGEGEYKFMLTGIDAHVNEDDPFDVDRFRIRIWYEDDQANEIVVYDNGLDAGDDDFAATELGGGSIVIHKAK
jgi:hypothetical protein